MIIFFLLSLLGDSTGIMILKLNRIGKAAKAESEKRSWVEKMKFINGTLFPRCCSVESR